MALSGNKGEWSEVYALFKLLADGQIYAGDASLNKLEDLFYPIIKIIRQEKQGSHTYELIGDLILISDKDGQVNISSEIFKKNALLLLSKIKAEKGAFTYPELDEFLEDIKCKSLKAKSTVKTDIRIVIYDRNIHQQADLGFSIKSQLGGDSTLLNAGKTTNFIYRVQNITLTDSEIEEINNINSRSKIKDRISAILSKGGHLEYKEMENQVFQNNLVLIDSLLPNIISELLISFNCTNKSTIEDLNEKLSDSNPLNFNITHAHDFYKYKMKRFLTDVALGMMPATVWNGVHDATGGYLIVKKDGEIVCYHIYNRNQFEDYLFHNTKMETASSTRHNFGSLYIENGEILFKLNLQIRFK